MALLGSLPQEAWIVAGILVVLAGAVFVLAVSRGQSISVAFKRGATQLGVDVGKQSGASQHASRSPAAIQGEVLRNGRVSGRSNVNVQIGNTTGSESNTPRRRK